MGSRSDDTIAKLANIKAGLADEDAATVIASACIHDPGAAEVAKVIGEALSDHLDRGGSVTALAQLAVSSVVFTFAAHFDTAREGSGEALDHMITTLSNIVRYSAERGFAFSRKERENGRTTND